MKKLVIFLLCIPFTSFASPLSGTWHLSSDSRSCSPAGIVGFVIPKDHKKVRYFFDNVRVNYENGVFNGEKMYLAKDYYSGVYYFGPYKRTSIYGYEVYDYRNKPIKNLDQLGDLAFLIGHAEGHYAERCKLVRV